jgi:rhamnosyltransferase subunit B
VDWQQRNCRAAHNVVMHILISCVGSAGDVYPFLAIGLALKQRGHEVELLTSPHFRSRIEAAGLSFVPLGTEADYQRTIGRADLWHARRGFEALWREMQPQFVEAHAALLARVQPGRTVLVGSTLAWYARMAHETHQLPLVTVHLSPICVFSALAPARLPGLGDLSGWPTPLVRLVYAALERGVIDRTVTPGLDAIRQRFGLPPVRRVLSQWVHSPQRVVCAWPEWYAPPQPDWPRHAVTTGFPHWPAAAGEVLPQSLEDFLHAGTAPIGFTPGSAMAHGRDFFARAVSACVAAGQRAVLITPFADQLPQPLPPSVHAVPYAPFDLLLPRLSALVHHGGIGTTAQALAAGLPQGVVPFAHDQFDNALRLVRLGVGVQLAVNGSERSWTQALTQLAHGAAIAAACKRHARVAKDELGAAQRIAKLIEAMSPQTVQAA